LAGEKRNLFPAGGRGQKGGEGKTARKKNRTSSATYKRRGINRGRGVVCRNLESASSVTESKFTSSRQGEGRHYTKVLIGNIVSQSEAVVA